MRKEISPFLKDINGTRIKSIFCKNCKSLCYNGILISGFVIKKNGLCLPD